MHSTKREAKGIGNSTTLKEDARTLADAKKVLLSLSESVSIRLRKEKMLAQSITVEIRYHDFTNTSHQCSLLSATNTTDALYKTAVSLFQQLWNSEPVRLLGIRTFLLAGSLLFSGCKKEETVEYPAVIGCCDGISGWQHFAGVSG